jgi:hypothetical protein
MALPMNTFRIQDLVVSVDTVCPKDTDTKASCHVTGVIPLDKTCPSTRAFPVLTGEESAKLLEDLKRELFTALEEVIWHQGLRNARRPEDGQIGPLIDELQEAVGFLEK